MRAYAKSDDLARRQLTVKSFPVFYRRLMRLRFPLDVAEIIDLRDVIKHASDDFAARPHKRQSRHFGAVASSQIEAIGVRATHHRQKLLQILIMLRDLHQAHRLRSRETEQSLRRRCAANREAQKVSVKYGVLAFVATAVAVATWAGLGDVGWPVKTVTVLLAYVSLDCFYSLSALNRYYHRLGQELDMVRRQRVRSFKWRALAYKLALILGYLHPAAISAFIDSSEEGTGVDHSLRSSVPQPAHASSQKRVSVAT